MIEDIITAISTPPGKGGIGIVRISGAGSVKLAGKFVHLKSGENLSDAPARTLHLSSVIDSRTGAVIDEAFAVRMKEHSSYTGEEMVEIQCHGSPYLLREVLENALLFGARIAQPGEFTRRAFLNGRIDLAQAEAVASLINSGSKRSSDCAIRQLSGGLSEKIEEIRKNIVDVLSGLEAAIEFPDEEIDASAYREKVLSLKNSGSEVRKLIEGALAGRIIREGYFCVIAGRANVGKSSLFNKILDYERSIVTEIPGTTRDFIVEGIELDGFPVRLVDTAGIMEGKDAAEEESIKRSFDMFKSADLVLFTIDSYSGILEKDREIYRMIKEHAEGIKIITVLNKADLGKKIDTEKAVKEFSGLAGVEVSAKKGTGIEILINAVTETLEKELSGIDMGITVNLRHLDCLKKAESALSSAVRLIEQSGPEEFTADDLKASLNALGEITGTTFTDEILDRIFEKFCIGK